MSKELQRLAMDVGLGAYESLPRLVGVALREERLPTAGPPQIMIRRTRDGHFWTGGTSARSTRWDPIRAQTYQDMTRAKQAAGHVRQNRHHLAGLSQEEFEELSKQVIVDDHEVTSRGNYSVWFYEKIEIVEVVPLELRITPVEPWKGWL